MLLMCKLQQIISWYVATLKLLLDRDSFMRQDTLSFFNDIKK